MSESLTIATALREGAELLRRAAIANDLLDAQTLLAESLGRDRTWLIINYREPLDDEAHHRYRLLIERRAAGEPLQYIIGRQEFFGLDFEVGPAVLIPRPETELIVEEAIRIASREDWPAPTIIDVGTGSGCLAVTIAREIPRARVIAIDLSPAALEVASRNARRNGLEERIKFVASDLLTAIIERPLAAIIVSNPPYIAAAEIAGLQREVREWEPLTALTDFADGLSFYRRLLIETASRLEPGGFFICELGYGQAAAVTAIVSPEIWESPRLLDDLQGIPRTMVVRRQR